MAILSSAVRLVKPCQARPPAPCYLCLDHEGGLIDHGGPLLSFVEGVLDTFADCPEDLVVFSDEGRCVCVLSPDKTGRLSARWL